MSDQFNPSRLYRKQIAIPQDHGSWVFLFSPLLIGLFAGNSFDFGSVLLTIAAIAAFLIRQPITMLIKIYSGRRSPRDKTAVLFWIGVYGVIAFLAVAGLIYLGYGYILYLAVPGIPVFCWYLYLVSRRAERRQAGVEIIASGVLALAAPAAYWIGIGGYSATGWWLFILTWFQSAASIVYAYLRLEQRELPAVPDLRIRIRLGRRSLIYTTFNLVGVVAFSLLGYLPIFLPLAYLVQWVETIWGVTHPAIGLKPTRIGIRQLLVSTLFTVVFIITWQF